METHTQVSSGIRTHNIRVQAVRYTTEVTRKAQDMHMVMQSGDVYLVKNIVSWNN
jgi:hypothetical protein